MGQNLAMKRETNLCPPKAEGTNYVAPNNSIFPHISQTFIFALQFSLWKLCPTDLSHQPSDFQGSKESTNIYLVMSHSQFQSALGFRSAFG